MIELLNLLQSPHFALVVFLVFVALLATGAGLVSNRDDHQEAQQYKPPASDEPPGPELEPELIARIIREAHRAARTDHAHGNIDRAPTHRRHSRAAVLWSGAYLGLRAELEQAERDRLQQRLGAKG